MIKYHDYHGMYYGERDLEKFIVKLGCENGENTKGPSRSNSYRILQDPWELASFLEYIHQHFGSNGPDCYLELGLGHAGLFRFMYEYLSTKFHVGVDDFSVKRFEQYRDINLQAISHYNPGRSLRIIKIDTQSIYFEGKFEPLTFELVFIDADHRYESVRHDVETVVRWMTPGGLIAFHDSIYYGENGGIARLLREIDNREIPELRRLRNVRRFERVYGIACYTVI